MAFERPTLQQLVDRIKNDFTSRLTSSSAVLRKSVIFIMSRVMAGAIHLLYGFLEWISKQIMPDTAESAQLERWATIWGIIRKLADFAQGNVIFTGLDGVFIEAGTALQRADGATFKTTVDVTIAGGTATVNVIADLAGVDGNTEDGIPLELISPIAGVQSTAIVAPVAITDGQDAESDELLLGRLLLRIQNPPAGGTAADFKRWALEVPGVTRAWVYPLNEGPGTVGIAFVLDGQTPTIFPDAPKIAEVQAYIDSKRPVTIDATVFAPGDFPVNFTLHISPDTPAVRAAIEEELKDMFTREAEPSAVILISHINEAISIAAGEYDHALSSPIANVDPGAGNLPTVGTFTYV